MKTSILETALQVAEQFGQAIAKGDFAGARALLTKQAKRRHTLSALKQAVTTMTAYANAPIVRARVMREFTLEDWPDKQAGDIAWVYVALEDKAFAEAARLALCKADEGVRIRQIGWGRP
ncbi:MAG: hypothetical protein HC853_10905 [Anaerolineae bacterium]|nr:hypothetical protein [Anaerolineae bacterium]